MSRPILIIDDNDDSLDMLRIALQSEFEDLRTLTSLNEVENLDLFECPVTSQGMQHLTAFKNLKSLEIQDTSVSDDGLELIGKIETLEALVIPLERITDKGVRHLTRLKNLRRLDLRFTRITSDGLQNIETFYNLESLALALTKIDDSAMKHLEHCRQLTDLDLFGCDRVTADGIQHLKSLPVLRKLNLSGTRVDDNALPFLKEMTGLRVLEITTSKSLGDSELLFSIESAKELLKVNPSAVIFVGSVVVRTIDLQMPFQEKQAGLIKLSVPKQWKWREPSPDDVKTRFSATEDGYEDIGYASDAGPAQISINEFQLPVGKTAKDLLDDIAPPGQKDQALPSGEMPRTIRVNAGATKLKNRSVEWMQYRSYETDLVTSHIITIGNTVIMIDFRCSRKRYALWQSVFDRVLNSVETTK